VRDEVPADHSLLAGGAVLTHELLLSLALAAIDDPEARIVLADALIESDWDDELVWTTEWYLGDPSPPHGRRLWSDADVCYHRDHAFAVAAVLLFGEWEGAEAGRYPWPVVQASLEPPSDGMGHFIRHSDGRIQAVDLLTWARRNATVDNCIERTEFEDGSYVSTVFLGIDHNFHDHSGRDPILFETMIFGEGRSGAEQWRWSTEAEARRAHALIVARFRENPRADLSDYDPL
jgi:hypothetical protein